MPAASIMGDHLHDGSSPHPKYARSEELGRQITEYKAWLNAGEYKWLTMVREFDQEGVWQHEGICSCAHWLNWKCGIGKNAAREKVRVANALGHLPKVSERYSKGEISYSKVRAITRIATPETEDYLLMIARHGTASHVESLVSKYRRCKRLADTRNANRQHAKRELTWFYDDDGSMVIRGRLPAEQGALIVKALELATERRDRQVRAERKQLRMGAANAKAAAAAAEARGHISAETPEERERRFAPGRLYYTDASEEVRPSEPFSARHADALGQLAEIYLARGPESSNTADRFQVVVHVSAETLKQEPHNDVSAEPNPFNLDFSYIEDGPHVSAETARRVGCDASKVHVTDDDDGEPLNIGRKTRSIPPGIRRALRSRDDGCRFPGCTHKHFIDGHHIRHWADGGETSLENLVQLCRFHHRLVHEGGFNCERRENGRFVFTNPWGDEIPDGDFLPPIPSDDNPFDWLKGDLDHLEIDADTGACRWQGERIDWPLAVGHLFDR